MSVAALIPALLGLLALVCAGRHGPRNAPRAAPDKGPTTPRETRHVAFLR